ncbi:High mobility group B protein 7 [Bienertia sinuspersici]
MATRKRVRAFNNTPRRAPDGSAFIKCDECGVSVAVALMDMHDCKVKKDVKKFKGRDLKPLIPENVSDDEQPRSPFMFFMESYSKSCEGKTLVEINREACEIWKKMPAKVYIRLPF